MEKTGSESVQTDNLSAEKGSKIEDVEIIIGKLLQIGVIASAVVMLAGLIMFLVTGNGGYPNGSFPTDLLVVFRDVAALKPYAVILTGLFLLILTPVFRVGVSIIVFLKEKDYLYVKITTAVFIILLVSFVLGKVE